MPLAKRDPTIIKHPFFQGTEELVIEDIVSLSVEGFGLSAEPLLSNLNWSRGVFALSGLKLAPDNLRVLSSSMFLLGSVFSHKKLNASNFWNFAAPTTLTLSIPDASVFQFLNGNLFSEYLDASTFTYSFSQARTPVSAPLLSDAGFFGFTLRAHLMPISATYTKLWISLTPFPLDTLLSDHPLASSPTFPGLKVLEGDIPLGPASSGPPLTKNWGCPISPAILLGAPLGDSDNFPSALTLTAAISAMLRKAIKPDLYSKSSKLLDRCQLILDNGASKLRNPPLDFIWPLPNSSASTTEGWSLSWPPPPAVSSSPFNLNF